MFKNKTDRKTDFVRIIFIYHPSKPNLLFGGENDVGY